VAIAKAYQRVPLVGEGRSSPAIATQAVAWTEDVVEVNEHSGKRSSKSRWLVFWDKRTSYAQQCLRRHELFFSIIHRC
jgi:hypothetical protein